MKKLIRKIFAVTSAVCMCGSVFSAADLISADSQAHALEAETELLGDVNNDGIRDLSDLSDISLYIIGDKQFSEKQKTAADIDGDSEVTLADLAEYKQHLCKIKNIFPEDTKSENEPVIAIVYDLPEWGSREQQQAYWIVDSKGNLYTVPKIIGKENISFKNIPYGLKKDIVSENADNINALRSTMTEANLSGTVSSELMAVISDTSEILYDRKDDLKWGKRGGVIFDIGDKTLYVIKNNTMIKAAIYCAPDIILDDEAAHTLAKALADENIGNLYYCEQS